MLAALPFFIAACASAPPRAPYPHESILTVIAELKIQLNKDPYRFAPGTDLEGGNIYRVTLARLKSLETMAGPEYADVLAYAEGECSERLGSWTLARDAFRSAAARETSLAADATRRANIDEKFAAATDRAQFGHTLQGYLNDLTVMQRRLEDLAATKPGYPYDSFLKLERQRGLEEAVRLNFTNRMVLADGLQKVLQEAGKQLETEFADGWRHSENMLQLGAVYETLARDLASQHPPEGAEFDAQGAWATWIEQARQAYRQVAEKDGDPAKPEGIARVRALEAYTLRVQTLGR